MALSWNDLRTRVYGFCDLSESRVATVTVDDWIKRAISDLADLTEKFPQLWDALLFLQKKSETEVLEGSLVSLPSAYLKLHPDIVVRGRKIRVLLDVPNRPRIQDSIKQPTIEEPIAVVESSSVAGITRPTLRIYPSKFEGSKVTFFYLGVPSGAESFSDEFGELLIASSSLVGLEVLGESDRVQSARVRVSEQLQKFGVTVK